MTSRAVWLVGTIVAVMATVSSGPSCGAEATPRPNLSWTTLGTAGGPAVQADRSQPANLLIVDGKPWIIDCGDGTSERLAAAGFTPAQVDAVFISHLHVDHTAGLLGLIAIRWMTRAPHVLKIYGPPGTERLVAGIISSLQPATEIGLGIQSSSWGNPIASSVEVVIVKGGADLILNGIRVRAVRNSHFADAQGRDAEDGSQSLSYRFDQGSYAIGYTGDTGPSQAVVGLERGADLLVSEVIDLEPMTAEISRHYPDMPIAAKQSLITHFKTQHLTPEEVGKLASEAHVKRLILTHLTAVGTTSAFAPRLIVGIRHSYSGSVVVAHDLDRFEPSS